MRTLIILLSLTFLAITTIFAQGHSATFSPEDTFSFVKIKLTTPKGKPYADAPVVLKGVNGHVVKVTTNKEGRVKAKVPTKDTYSVHCGENQCMKTIAISEFPYVTYNYQAYTQRFIYLTFTYQTPRGTLLEGEHVTVHSIKTGKQYKDSTNAKGQCYFILPFDPEFRVQVKYHPNVVMLNPIDVGKEYKVMSANFKWMGSKESERRARISDSLALIYNLDVMAIMDSLAKIGDEEAIIEMDAPIPMQYDSSELVVRLLKVKAEIYKKELNKNPKYFEEQNKAVLAPLYRLRNKFPNQIIVTDITGSMYGYMDQVMIWHALNFMEKKRKKYIFFNDGDRMSSCQKTIGSAGGLYFCEGKIKDFKMIVRTMRKGIINGNGGDVEENDIEALLEASKKRGSDELFLIAHNRSPVRDIELMTELKVPVHIILCGVEYRGTEKTYYNLREINEQYLNLAYATGGSVHTVKEDVYDLSKTQDGGSITLDGVTYEFKNNSFTVQQKL